MAIAHSTAQSKPSKPYADFPLTAHRNGQWCKKIRGKLHYFGPWADHEGALDRYDKVKDDLHAGKTPRPIQDELTLSDLVNHFLTAKRNRVDSGELSMRTWKDYYASTKRILNQFGKNRLLSDLRSDDFAKFRNLLDKTLGPVALGNEIQRARTLFKYAFEEDFVATQIKFGSSFKKPTMKTLRKHRAESRLEHGKRMFEPQDVHRLIRDASLPMRAMILLGINCGFGNNDCASLPLSALDLATSWIDFPRPKTGIGRRCKLWPETVQALRDWLPARPKPRNPDHDRLVFITKPGGTFQQALAAEQQAIDSPISKQFAKLLVKLGLKRHGLNFYALRHGFETIAGASRDQPAVDHVMGHARDDMASVYREGIDDDRLEAVAEHVRAWLFKKDQS